MNDKIINVAAGTCNVTSALKSTTSPELTMRGKAKMVGNIIGCGHHPRDSTFLDIPIGLLVRQRDYFVTCEYCGSKYLLEKTTKCVNCGASYQ